MFYARFTSLALVPAFLFSLFFAHASYASDCHPVMWNEVKKLAQDCGAGTECESFRLVNEAQATFQLQGKSYDAVLSDSEDSDGGDLNDVIATSEDGACVLELRNVLGFGSLLQALSWIEISSDAVSSESR